MAVILFAATGCTICPDPFDYSGPVPDGSAPQNDFHARANGILPLGGVPRPWPPVVQAVPQESGEDESRPTPAGGAEPADTAADADQAPVQPAAAEAEAAIDADPETAEQPIATEPAVDDILPPPAPARLPILPPLRETPGWRPRG